MNVTTITQPIATKACQHMKAAQRILLRKKCFFENCHLQLFAFHETIYSSESNYKCFNLFMFLLRTVYNKRYYRNLLISD